MLSFMLCTPKIDAYPVLQNAVEWSDVVKMQMQMKMQMKWLIDFAELLILN